MMDSTQLDANIDLLNKSLHNLNRMILLSPAGIGRGVRCTGGLSNMHLNVSMSHPMIMRFAVMPCISYTTVCILETTD